MSHVLEAQPPNDLECTGSRLVDHRKREVVAKRFTSGQVYRRIVGSVGWGNRVSHRHVGADVSP